MSLETRVETLEHELKILKNEIERTLLEIQNQVLIHYYPSLRAEDATPPKELLPLLESAFSEVDEPASSLAKRPPEEEGTPAPPPKTKEVSLTDIKRKPAPPLPTRDPAAVKGAVAPANVTIIPAKVPPAAPAPVATLPWPAETIQQNLFPLLAKWVNESVEKIGKELTQNMVESAANAEQIAPEVLTLLLQFIALCEEEQPPAMVDTKILMDALLKLDKLLAQVAKLVEHAANAHEEHNG